MSIFHAVFARFTKRLVFIALMLSVGLLAVNSSSAQSSRAGTGEVIAVRECKFKPGVDLAKFERFIIEKYNPTMEGAYPGVKAFVTKVERGEKKGGYAFIFIFDSQNTLNAITTGPDQPMGAWFVPFWEKTAAVRNELDEYMAEDWFSKYNDYTVLR